MYKCAIYTRVSTEEQAENPEGSIKNQELRLREYVKLKNMVAPFGEVAAVFSDPGVSAKDMNRPAFQRLLKAMEKREINLVLVTELSRFTRSMKDFSLLQEFMKKHGCEFLSLRENFDSSSATGSLVMSIMATLAEFERKQTAERISNSFHERAKRGLYNGGPLPLGYEVDKAKNGHLAVVPEEAELVRRAFQVFLEEENVANAAKRLNKEGPELPRTMRSASSLRGRQWQFNMLVCLLKNKAYVGIRQYTDKGGRPVDTEASWEPIVDLAVFERAQVLLAKNKHRRQGYGQSRYPYTLSGSIFCKTCGHRMAGKSATGKSHKIAYYDHSWQQKQNATQEKAPPLCTSHRRILANRIEPRIWNDVKAFLVDEQLAKTLLAKAKAKKPKDEAAERRIRTQAQIDKAARQIEALAERIADLPKGLDARPFYSQMEKLQGQQKQLAADLEAIVSTQEPNDQLVSCESLKAFTESFRALLEKGDQNPEVQAAIIRKVVHKIEVLPDGYEIFYHAGTNHYERELGNGAPSSAQALEDGFGKGKGQPPLPLSRSRSQPHSIFSRSSTLFLNGGNETIAPFPIITQLVKKTYALSVTYSTNIK